MIKHKHVGSPTLKNTQEKERLKERKMQINIHLPEKGIE